MEPQATIHERRQLNLEIESAFIAAAETCVHIQVHLYTTRAGPLLDLYERFYSAFALLVILTSDLNQLSKSQEKVKKAIDWIKATKFNREKDDDVKARCESGYEVFMAYKRLLTEQGVISLPVK